MVTFNPNKKMELNGGEIRKHQHQRELWFWFRMNEGTGLTTRREMYLYKGNDGQYE